MYLLFQLVQWEVMIFLVALAGIVAFQLLTGQINTTNLLEGKMGDAKGQISPERVQLLFTTIGFAIYYATQAGAVAKTGNLPDIPSTVPALLGGSNAIYLGGKAYNRWFTDNGSK